MTGDAHREQAPDQGEMDRAAPGRALAVPTPRGPAAEPMRVLFVCTGNSARSQIAEALLRQYEPDFRVESAGTEPRGVSPFTVRVLDEVGIDWSAAQSKGVGQFLDQAWDYVITVCDRARESCPVFPGSHESLHWGLDDPAEVTGSDYDKLTAFRQTRMDVANRLRTFVEVARQAHAASHAGG